MERGLGFRLVLCMCKTTIKKATQAKISELRHPTQHYKAAPTVYPVMNTGSTNPWIKSMVAKEQQLRKHKHVGGCKRTSNSEDTSIHELIYFRLQILL